MTGDVMDRIKKFNQSFDRVMTTLSPAIIVVMTAALGVEIVARHWGWVIVDVVILIRSLQRFITLWNLTSPRKEK